MTRLNHADLDALYVVFAVFFSTNLMISYWEVCLFHKRDYIEERGAHWRARHEESGRSRICELERQRARA